MWNFSWYGETFLSSVLPFFLAHRSRYAKEMRREPGSVRERFSGGAVRVKRAIDKSSKGKRAALPGSYRTYSPFAAYPTDDLIYTSVLITIDFSPSAGKTRPMNGRFIVAHVRCLALSVVFVRGLWASRSSTRGNGTNGTCRWFLEYRRQASEKFINHFLNIETSARLIPQL